MDIDNLDLVLYHRQRDLINRLVRVSAHEIAPLINQLTAQNCIGCKHGHLSQAHHNCHAMERDERVYRYFDSTVEKMSKATIEHIFAQSISNEHPKIQYNVENWKSAFCVEQRRMLKHETLCLL
jgi:S-methylmethionine-dependent homocysteine/selenocysteine methylase